MDTDNNNQVLLRTELRHEAGGIIHSTVPLRDQGTEQTFGSSVTYRRRYALVSILGIAAEDDDDGATASSQFKAPKPKRQRDATGEAEDITDYLSESQRRKLYALRSKLVKAGVFTEEVFTEVRRQRIRSRNLRAHQATSIRTHRTIGKGGTWPRRMTA